MKLPKKQAAVVRAALEEWRASGLLDEETGKRLLDDLTPLPFDWYRLGRYALWSALTCILIGVAALLGDELFLELISRLFVMTELGRSLFLILAAAGLFFWGVRRRRRAPQKRLTNEGLFFLGVLAIAGSLAAWLYAYGGEGIGFLNISSLFLLAAVIYGALGLLLDSRLIWVFALFAFGSWLGAETGYRSGWGAYYLGMNYPMRFVLLGLLLCGLSVLFKRNDLWSRLAAFERSTLSVGLLYLFISLWILSIFGDYGDMTSWYQARHMELFHWSLLFGAAACAAIWLGVKDDDAMLRGYGLVFLGLNLYTRFFEWFWDSLNKGLFFIIVGLSLFALACAEKLLLTKLVYGTMGAFMPEPVQLASGYLHSAVTILFLLLVARDALLLLTWPFRRSTGRQRKIFYGHKEKKPASGFWAFTLVLLALALSGYGMREALRVPPVREVRMQVPGLPDALNGFRIAQLSDLHIGPTFGKAWLTDVVARTDSLNPDLIVITGDVVDGSPSRLEEDVAPLADLKAKYGVIFAPGNHEYYSGIQQWLPVFQRLGMHVLMNENTQIRVNGTPLAIAGVTDTAALNWGLEGPDPEKALSGLSKDITKLMLSHRPSLAPESAKAGASLQLSGHTHGGLILPVTPLIAAFNGGYVSGPYTVDGMPLYVSSGSGLWGGIPLRLFVPSEITLITLTGTGFDTN